MTTSPKEQDCERSTVSLRSGRGETCLPLRMGKGAGAELSDFGGQWSPQGRRTFLLCGRRCQGRASLWPCGALLVTLAPVASAALSALRSMQEPQLRTGECEPGTVSSSTVTQLSLTRTRFGEKILFFPGDHHQSSPNILPHRSPRSQGSTGLAPAPPSFPGSRQFPRVYTLFSRSDSTIVKSATLGPRAPPPWPCGVLGCQPPVSET